jgi:hypothetical protein
MNDIVETDRATPEGQRGTPLPIWSSRGARPQSDEGFAKWPTAGATLAHKDRGLSSRQRTRPRASQGDPSRQLIEAILRHFGRDKFALVRSRHSPWASITFSGARHEVTIEQVAPNGCIQGKLDAISEAIFTLSGHLLADITARLDPTGPAMRIMVEALTVESA